MQSFGWQEAPRLSASGLLVAPTSVRGRGSTCCSKLPGFVEDVNVRSLFGTVCL
jgi:hypothetical protein